MHRLRFVKWRKGLNSIELIKRVMERGQIPLKEAHELISKFLEGEAVEVDIGRSEDAVRLIEESNRLGADVEQLY